MVDRVMVTTVLFRRYRKLAYTLQNESDESTLKEFGQWQHFIQLDLT